VRPKRTQPLTTRSLLIATEITFEGTGVYFVITPGSSRFVRDWMVLFLRGTHFLALQNEGLLFAKPRKRYHNLVPSISQISSTALHVQRTQITALSEDYQQPASYKDAQLWRIPEWFKCTTGLAISK
jgi:hypothetical protein